MKKVINTILTFIILLFLCNLSFAQQTPEGIIKKDYPCLYKIYEDSIAKQTAHYIFALDVSSMMKTNVREILPVAENFIRQIPDNDKISFVKKSATNESGIILNSQEINSSSRNDIIKFLYDNFGWERPEYIHLTPIMKDENRKLSKRHGDANFDDFINKGYLAEAIVNYIALLGWSPKDNQEKFTMEQLINSFSVSGLSRSSSVFDEVKMKWLNGEYIKELSFDNFMNYAIPYFEKSNINGKYDYNKFGHLLQSRIETFGEIPEKVSFITNYHKFDKNLYYNKRFKIDYNKAREVIEISLSLFNKLDNWLDEELNNIINKTAEVLEIKSGAVYSVLRLAISGVQITPGGAVEIADILGKEETIERLNKALNWLKD